MSSSSRYSSFGRPWILSAALLAGVFGAGCEGEKAPVPSAETPAKDPQKTEEQAKAAPEATAPAENAAAAAGEKEAQNQGGAAKAEPGKTAQDRAPTGQPAAPNAAPTAEPTPDPAAPATAEAKPSETAAPAPTSAAGDARVAEVTSPKVGESNFSVWMQSAKSHKVGQPGVVEVVLIPKNGFKCNENYPYKIKLNDPPAGISFPQSVVRKEGLSYSPQRSVLRVPFTPTAAGEARISGKFSFSVCTSDQCLIDARDLAITVKAE
ncbi:MAG: hypothetical protein L6Q76_02415 [Polyangiaceae bacterium]|nr:hypothetical protein [Polyangiaceae bacterium]